MNTGFELGQSEIGGSLDKTVDFAQADGVSTSSSGGRRFQLAMPGGGPVAASQDIAPILRRRLLIAALIPAFGYSAFFIRDLIDPQRFLGATSLTTIVLGSAAALFTLIAALLGSHLRLLVTHLRIVEFALFGALATYFGFVQWVMFSHGAVTEWAAAGYAEHVVRLANGGNILRWFALIVIYGTFVPNTWKRCAVFTGIWMAIPIGLVLVHCADCPIMGPHMLNSLFDTVTLLSIGAAVAIFGSYKISELRQEAVQARQLGQYQLKKKLGKGGMGEVYLAEHVLLRRDCAIKLIRPEQAGDLTSISRFEREVQAMATLTHWNTVEVFDYGVSDDGVFYYVMEFLPGKSLHDIVEKHGPLPPARAVHFLLQVCDGLREAHSINLIHRDIKPSNVLATERGVVRDVAKLLDFGLVQTVGLGAENNPRLTMQGTVLGSPPYMSPEQAMGKKDVDARTDIYSFGGLAYFLLTGRQPFVRETAMQVLMAHVHDDPQPPSELQPDLPADVEAVIMRCLQKKPDNRFQCARELQDALAACACAGDWTRDDAEEWWRQHMPVLGPDDAGCAPRHQIIDRHRAANPVG